jgi:hypothetical protein
VTDAYCWRLAELTVETMNARTTAAGDRLGPAVCLRMGTSVAKNEGLRHGY